MSDALKDYSISIFFFFLQTVMDTTKPEQESCFLIKSRLKINKRKQRYLSTKP